MDRSTYKKLFVKQYRNLDEITINQAINNTNDNLKSYLERGRTILENYHNRGELFKKNKGDKIPFYHGIVYKLICLASSYGEITIAKTIRQCKFRKDIDECFFKKKPLTLREILLDICTSCADVTHVVNWIVSYIQPPKIIINDCFLAACRYDCLPVAKILASYADIHCKNDYAFRWAFAEKHIDVCKWLMTLDSNVDIYSQNNFVLRKACKQSYIEGIDYLLYLGFDMSVINKLDPEFYSKCPFAVIKYLFGLRTGFDFHSWIKFVVIEYCKSNENRLDEIKWLANNGCDIKHYAEYCLIQVCEHSCDINLLEYLSSMKKEISPTIFNECVFKLAESGNVPAFKWFYQLGNVTQCTIDKIFSNCIESYILEYLYELGFIHFSGKILARMSYRMETSRCVRYVKFASKILTENNYKFCINVEGVLSSSNLNSSCYTKIPNRYGLTSRTTFENLCELNSPRCNMVYE